MRGLIVGGLALAAVAVSGAARAACEVDGRPVDFDTIDTTRSNDGVGEVIVSCDDETSFEVALGGGRTMQGPGDAELRYELYQDPGHNVRWGDGGGTGEPRSGRTDDGSARLPVYGSVPAQPSTSPGDYIDQIEITLIF